MKRNFKIEVDCPVCAGKMEIAANKVAGIKSAVVNFMTLKMLVDFEDGVEYKNVMDEVKKACKHIDSDIEIYY